VTEHHCGDGRGVGWLSCGGFGYGSDFTEVAGAEDARGDDSKCAGSGRAGIPVAMEHPKSLLPETADWFYSVA
jgi:hypothetical protein